MKVGIVDGTRQEEAEKHHGFTMRGGLKMDKDEALELIKKVFECSIRNQESEELAMHLNVPNPQVYDGEKDGISLSIKNTIKNDAFLVCLKAIVDKRKLKIKQSAEYFIIYTPRKA
jgi:hypothetical protein